MANLTLRLVKGSALTIAEMDGNFEYFTGSYTNTGTITAQAFVGNLSGSVTGSILGNVTGNVTGNLTGNVTGNVTGDVTGSILGNVIGNVTGSVNGNADTSTTASYVDAMNVDGTVANAATASLAAALPTSAPGSPVVGSIYFDSSTPSIVIYDGSNWYSASLSLI